jgi:hypothetical protein
MFAVGECTGFNQVPLLCIERSSSVRFGAIISWLLVLIGVASAGLCYFYKTRRLHTQTLWPFVLISFLFSGSFLFVQSPKSSSYNYLFIFSIIVYTLLFSVFFISCSICLKSQGIIRHLRNFFQRYRLPISLLVLISFFLLTVAVNINVFYQQPLLEDNKIFYDHAKAISQGNLFVTHVKTSGFFILHKPHGWYSVFPPGYLFALAAALYVNIPYLLNPILGFLSALYFLNICRTLDSKRSGRGTLAFILFVTSPWVIVMFSEYSNGAMSMLAYLISVRHLIDSEANRTARGLSLGAAYALFGLVRPFTALGAFIFSVPVVLIGKNLRFSWRVFIPAALIALFGLALFLYYNFITNGDPLVSGYELKFGKSHNPGFGITPTGGYHTLYKGIWHVVTEVKQMQIIAHGWFIPSFAFLFFGIYSIIKSRDARLSLITLSGLGVILIHIFYWGEDQFFGPRFFFESMPALCLLTSWGIFHVYEYLVTKSPRSLAAPLFVLIVVTNIIFSLFCFLPGELTFYKELQEYKLFG